METKHKQFNAFDKVLVRDSYDKWDCDIYSHYDKDEKKHLSIGFGWVLDNDILPYEGNEALVGTTDEPEEEIKLEEGEWIVVFDKEEMYYPPYFIGKFSGLHANMFITNESCERELAIPLSGFNPNDMKETKKHILCVRNGKIVKYKE